MSTPEFTAPYPLHSPKSGTLNPLMVTTVFGGICLFTTVMRLVSRKIKKIPYGWDDVCVVVASFWTFAMFGLQWALVVRGGVGHHASEINPYDIVLTLKMILAFEAIYAPANCFTKFAILFFYLRLFGAERAFQRKVWIVGCIVLMWAIHIILETFLICRPLAMNWGGTTTGHCGNRNAMFVVAGATNMVTDLMVILLPVPTIWRLQMPLLKKVGIVALFSLGTFISVISIIRLKSLLAIDFEDVTATLPMGLMWSILEPELGLINANLPVIRPFIQKLFPKIFKTSYFSRGGYSHGPSRIGGGKIITNGGKSDLNRFERLKESASGGRGTSEEDGTYPLHSIAAGRGDSNGRNGGGETLSRQTTPTPVTGMFDPTKPKYNVAVSSQPVLDHDDTSSRDANTNGKRNPYMRQDSSYPNHSPSFLRTSDEHQHPTMTTRESLDYRGPADSNDGIQVKKEFSVRSD